MIGFIAFGQSRSSKTKRGICRYPASVLAPESALGSLPSVALSSAQADPILIRIQNPVALVITEGVENLVLDVVHMAGFEVATHGRFWGGHRGTEVSTFNKYKAEEIEKLNAQIVECEFSRTIDHLRR